MFGPWEVEGERETDLCFSMRAKRILPRRRARGVNRILSQEVRDEY